MVRRNAASPDEYLRSVPDDRRPAIDAVRRVILDNLPAGHEEGISFGMLSYHVPLERSGPTYNGQPLGIAALANQKRYMSLYLMGVYGDPDIRRWFVERWETTGKKLDMGKSCVRFRRPDELPLELIGETMARLPVEDYLAMYRAVRRP
jgi:hypothetical protein